MEFLVMSWVLGYTRSWGLWSALQKYAQIENQRSQSG